MAFRKGDTVVHPEHGAAVVQEVREKEFLGEKRMITKARQILISELAFATGKSEDEAEAVIDGVLDDSHGVKVSAAEA